MQPWVADREGKRAIVGEASELLENCITIEAVVAVMTSW